MSSELKTTLDNVADAVTLNPSAAAAVLRATSELVGPFAVDVSTGDHCFRVDEPALLGGEGSGPNPVEHAIGALGACWAITWRLWSVRLGVAFEHLNVRAEGDLDVRGMFGLDHDVRPGPRRIRLHVTVSGPEPIDRYEALADRVDAHCPLLDLFTHGTTIERAIRPVVSSEHQQTRRE